MIKNFSSCRVILKFQLMRIKLREYKTTDYEQLEQLFYNTVHSVNAKDYTKE